MTLMIYPEKKRLRPESLKIDEISISEGESIVTLIYIDKVLVN